MTLISLQLLFPCLYRLNLTRYRPPALGLCAGIISHLTSDVTKAAFVGTALQTGIIDTADYRDYYHLQVIRARRIAAVPVLWRHINNCPVRNVRNASFISRSPALLIAAVGKH